MRGQLAEQALQNFEAELGLKSPETTRMSQAAKDLGPPPKSRPARIQPWQTDSQTGFLRRSSARRRRPRRPRVVALRRDRNGAARPDGSRPTS